METWKVNSYSYPNPFQGSGPADGAWEMFQSFLGNSSYSSVKAYWGGKPGRRVSAHSVESWKATFEEFGLLYVLSGADKICITPGGKQLADAAEAGDEREFAWIGINLLLRYPLRGNETRRSRGDAFNQSDLLLYWFLLASFLDLECIWQSEINRILCEVFRRDKAPEAISLIQQVRDGTRNVSEFIDPTDVGGVYNAINQVMVHGSLNHMIFTRLRESSAYFDDTMENRWSLNSKYKDIVELALGGQALPLPIGCGVAVPLIQRMPVAPIFDDEQAYFDHLGATVLPLSNAQKQASINGLSAKDYAGEAVYFLIKGTHFNRIDGQQIVGPIHLLCKLMPEQRIVVDDDLANTYLVDGKTLSAGGQVTVHIRRARRILDAAYVKSLF